jgi:cytidylate kinase
MPSINHISAVYVTGIAGSGKSSSVIQMGLKLAVEILEDSGYMNAVLPVATFESQIEIVSKSVGKLSKGMEGMSVDNLHKMLKLAVIEQDEDAIATLSAIGIAIDEATYVQAVTVVNDDMVELESIDDLIKKFNEIHNITGHKIGLLLLGDPRQSYTSMKEFYETSLKVRRAS